MSRYTGGLIKSSEFTTSRFGTNSGMFTLGQQINANAQGKWPGSKTTVSFVGNFIESGSWICPAGVESIDYIVIGGGGGGGSDMGGGGGAGGFRIGSSMPVVAGKTYSINIGGGGLGGYGGPSGPAGEDGCLLYTSPSPRDH